MTLKKERDIHDDQMTAHQLTY